MTLTTLPESVREFVTAGGQNTLSDSLYYASDDREASIREAASAGWEWPGSPTQEELHDAFDEVAADLAAELEER